ncbi:Major Facilitator Superfamily (MFS) transporter [Phytophthora megakarya]|uniref:Major Facilitator Superfamily (MFS) transporter n=1 Tax=Phytophthora megakarya TaxID=4795 RepID=A0A225W8Y5_9STRA|nr:Major Facilitator Superfamily (MFS) transporter [Phytophthora megakarya]
MTGSYTETASPAFDEVNKLMARLIKPNSILYTSMLLSWHQPFQSEWSKSVSNIWAFAVGRLIAGLASGIATGTIGAYVNELSPPHLRNTLGLGLQILTTLGILVPAICFFFANTSNGWRYLAASPCVLVIVYLLLAPTFSLESPAWLLTKCRTEEAIFRSLDVVLVVFSCFDVAWRLDLVTCCSFDEIYE